MTDRLFGVAKCDSTPLDMGLHAVTVTLTGPPLPETGPSNQSLILGTRIHQLMGLIQRVREVAARGAAFGVRDASGLLDVGTKACDEILREIDTNHEVQMYGGCKSTAERTEAE